MKINLSNNKFIYDRKHLTHTKNIIRTRINEERNLAKGIRLNRNERVEGYPKRLLSKIFSKTKSYDLAKYPDQNIIYKKLSQFFNLSVENFFLTPGIDGGIKCIFEVFTKPGDKILVLQPSYAMYEIYSGVYKTKLSKVTYDPKSFRLNRRDLIAQIKKKPKILFLPNPNQPIEDNLSLNDIKKLCTLCYTNKVLLVVDEAYYMFGSVSAKNLIYKYENLIVLRTFSKSFGLPSIRLGLVISRSKIINILKSFRLSYETNFLTDQVAIYFLKNFSFVKNYIEKVKRGREYFRKKVKNLGFDVIGKDSNFLLINFKSEELCKSIYKGLLSNLIYVKGNYSAPLNTCLLLTCGPVYIMKKVYLVIKQSLSNT
jgi:histidinol-phosphate aminotransferase